MQKYELILNEHELSVESYQQDVVTVGVGSWSGVRIVVNYQWISDALRLNRMLVVFSPWMLIIVCVS